MEYFLNLIMFNNEDICMDLGTHFTFCCFIIKYNIMVIVSCIINTNVVIATGNERFLFNLNHHQ